MFKHAHSNVTVDSRAYVDIAFFSQHDLYSNTLVWHNLCGTLIIWQVIRLWVIV